MGEKNSVVIKLELVYISDKAAAVIKYAVTKINAKYAN